MQIDIRTLIAVLAITHLIQVLVFWQQYRINRVYAGPRWWLLWCLAEAIGFFSFLLRQIPGLTRIAILVQNSLLLLGVVFLYIGILRFLGRKENVRAIAVSYGVWFAGLLYFLFINDNIGIRTMLICGGAAIVSFGTAHAWLTAQPRRGSAIGVILGLTFVAHGAIMALRIPAIAAEGVALDVFAPTRANLVTYFDALAVGLLWTYGLIMMLNQRLVAESIDARARFEQIFGTIPDCVIITRLEDAMIVAVNQGFITLTGYAREDAIGKTTLAVGLWKDGGARDRLVRELRLGEVNTNIEAEFVRKDGTVFVGLLSAKVIDLGGTRHLLSITRDITERKRAEEQLAISEERFRRMFAEGPIGMAIVSPDLRFIKVNLAFCRFIGYSEDELTALTFRDVTHPDHLRQDVESIQKLCRGEIPVYSTEKRYIRKDGTVVWGTLTVSALFDRSGKLLFLIPMIVDITGRKAAEELDRHRISELQQMHGAMLDREDRVQELKGEVNTLLKKLGQAVKYGK